MSVALSVIVVAAPAASAAATTSLKVVLTNALDICPHYDLRYTGQGETNNITITANYQQPTYSDEAYCPNPEAHVAVVDTVATIAAEAPWCTASGSVGTCSAEQFDRVVVSTGAGDDTIRVGPLVDKVTVILAGAGNDTIRALNGSYDNISCGDGQDVVIADPHDTIASDCEVVQFS